MVRPTGPRYALADVKQAGAERALRLRKQRCSDHLLVYLPTLVACIEFVGDLAAGLSLDDFVETVTLSGIDWDVYAVRVPNDVLEKHGMEGRTTWSVKVRLLGSGIVEAEFLSTHALERDEPRRRGGLLRPEW